MENESPLTADESRSSRRGRFMDKLFGGKERKSSESSPNSQAALDAFLHSPAGNLEITHAPPPPPKLAKLDTTITRYPQALAVNQQAQLNRPVAPGKKGLVVRFADSYPDIIGEGGDESEMPVIEIRKHNVPRRPLAASPRAPIRTPAASPGGPPGAASAGVNDDFQPKSLARSQTGYSSIYEPDNDPAEEAPRGAPPTRNNADMLLPGRAANARFLETSDRADENRRSFIEVHRAQMRKAEGTAFAQASRTASTASQHDGVDGDHPASGMAGNSLGSVRRRLSASPDVRSRQVPVLYSPAASITSNTSSTDQQPQSSQSAFAAPPPGMGPFNGSSPAETPLSARMASVRLRDAGNLPKDDALNIFVARTRHLFELFRLHAEAVKPLTTCSLRECARGGLWWFLKGRMGLELAIRDRPSSPKSQMQNELDRQQAYSNLAKGYWLCEEAIPEIADAQRLAPDGESAGVVQSLISALRKLSQSMNRNGILPPEEPFLPQTIDKSIWLDYPPLSQDIVALLSGNWGSGLTAMQHPTSSLQLLDAFPLGDTAEKFNYARVMADAYLMEQGRETQRVHFPCILSIVRPQKEKGLVFMIASQNGSVQLAVQENKNAGLTWDDVRWRNDACNLDVRLPRGFRLAVQLSQVDYRMVWNMYDFGAKIQATLRPRSDELVVFRNSLRSFQYLESEPPSRAFPKEPLPRCEVALMEKIYKESGPAGPRTWHCGFRIAVATGPLTRTVNGVQHSFSPSFPVQFGFFRAEGDAPALSVKYESGRQRGRMVFIFGDEKERVSFQSLLTGTALNHDERVFADIPLKSFMISQSVREPIGVAPFSRMPWRAARVVNDEFCTGGEHPSTVLADKLKVVLEYQNGTVTDRVNVAPGELRMRLEVSNAKVLRVLRQPQKDMTVSVSEAQVPKELPRDLSDAMQLLKASQTIRSYEFNNLKDLHDFQAALTGFEVVFDGLAATFAISRRRMVVPIHKKWEAGFTRIQVVRLEDRQVQLLAFFEEFHHGHCMNFVLKGTDVYESFHRGGKSGLKFVDAKFPLPRVPADKDADFDDMAFVCLDLPDLPGEHDDISIMFEKESDRDRLCELLPAPTKGSSRMSSRLK
ncbi:hypothetical protein HRG_005648 [Hirsutella rhossiliensis]|uniref:Uncharacterized protein n=1 Tax=Hirsutella rhossiliensis TaxID=111463 RepID=A0A9P8SHI3_9HYPO|nr:uncharacterized protein HRG_05648 [Hirsutella rhossiliensis]KAH0963138.1 hypothetical protein HRG_05648 [Hirsutella rhossiliensis]